MSHAIPLRKGDAMQATFEQQFSYTTPPFVVLAGNPTTDSVLIRAVQNAYRSSTGLADFDIREWTTNHMSYLTHTYQFTGKATQFGFTYVWLIMFSYMFARELEQDNALRFRRPHLPFGLARKSQLTHEDLYLLHVAAYAQALGSRLSDQDSQTSAHLTEFYGEVIQTLSERVWLKEMASASLVRDGFLDGKLVHKARTNHARWFANLTDLALRYQMWPGQLPT